MSTHSVDIPVIGTERLVLRGPDLADLAALTRFFDSNASHFVGGPMGANDTHRAMLSTIGGWALYGFGLWHIAIATTNRFVGWTGLLLTAGKQEAGFAWTVLPEFQGKGMAREAARAALDDVTSRTGHRSPATFIDGANRASIRLAETLGFRHEATDGSELTYRYAEGVA